MKKTITITVDVETFLLAQDQLGKGNVSKYLNECLLSYTNKNRYTKRDEVTTQLEETKKSLEELSIKKSILESELKSIEDAEVLERKEAKDREQFKRWICPICKKPKLLDSSYCDSCRLNTRPKDESKIVYTFINEVVKC